MERAFELARTGLYRRWPDVAQALQSEKFEQVKAHFDSPSLRKQISAACAAAKR